MTLHLDDTLVALADETRRSILGRLAAGEARVTEVAAPFDISLNSVSKHIRILERAGLVRRRVEGRNHHCRLDATRLARAQRWLAFYETFWDEKLDALDTMLAERRAGRTST